jgi:hypothetical protein
MGHFRPPQLNEQEWLTGKPFEMVVNFAISLGSRKFDLAKVAQFRHILEKLDEKGRLAIGVIEAYAEDPYPDGQDLDHGAKIDAFQHLYQVAVERGELPAVSAVDVRDLYEVFGNPFRPVPFSPLWRTESATSIARKMYKSRDFSDMPILSDALRQAGCENEDILNHCRGAGPHVRGCWVVDLVLGKE